MALGFGFRCGFLGLLHMDIVKERLEREFDLELIATAPNVEFHVIRGDEMDRRAQPGGDARAGHVRRVEEPFVFATIITPADYLGAGDRALPSRAAASMVDMTYLTPERAEIHYMLPLAEIVFDFFDQLKSRTRGLRVARLRAVGLPGGRPRPGRRPAARRARRRVQHGRAPGQGATRTASRWSSGCAS